MCTSYLHTLDAFRPPPLAIDDELSDSEVGVVYSPRHNDDYSSEAAREAAVAAAMATLEETDSEADSDTGTDVAPDDEAPNDLGGASEAEDASSSEADTASCGWSSDSGEDEQGGPEELEDTSYLALASWLPACHGHEQGCEGRRDYEDMLGC